MSARAWLAWCQSAEPVPRRPVLLTFDDAYSDLHDHAFPALDANGYGATLFAPAGYLGKENLWDQALRAGSHTVTHRLLESTAVVAWHRRGIEVGAHSRTHARLPTLSSQDLMAELEGSKRDLERLLDAPVTTFAYPFGAVDERVRDATASVFDAAFTIDEGLNTLATDPLMLRRSARAAERHAARSALLPLVRLEPAASTQGPAEPAAHPMRPGFGMRLRRVVPSGLRRAMRRRGLAAWPPRGAIRFGSLRRTRPISSDFGFDRGMPADRYYIEAFVRVSTPTTYEGAYSRSATIVTRLRSEAKPSRASASSTWLRRGPRTRSSTI